MGRVDTVDGGAELSSDSVQAGAHCAGCDAEDGRHVGARQFLPAAKQQHLAIIWIQFCDSAQQAGRLRLGVDSVGHRQQRVERRGPLATELSECTQVTFFGAPVASQQIRGDAEQPHATAPRSASYEP